MKLQSLTNRCQDLELSPTVAMAISAPCTTWQRGSLTVSSCQHRLEGWSPASLETSSSVSPRWRTRANLWSRCCCPTFSSLLFVSRKASLHVYSMPKICTSQKLATILVTSPGDNKTFIGTNTQISCLQACIWVPTAVNLILRQELLVALYLQFF